MRHSSHLDAVGSIRSCCSQSKQSHHSAPLAGHIPVHHQPAPAASDPAPGRQIFSKPCLKSPTAHQAAPVHQSASCAATGSPQPAGKQSAVGKQLSGGCNPLAGLQSPGNPPLPSQPAGQQSPLETASRPPNLEAARSTDVRFARQQPASAGDSVPSKPMDGPASPAEAAPMGPASAEASGVSAPLDGPVHLAAGGSPAGPRSTSAQQLLSGHSAECVQQVPASWQASTAKTAEGPRAGCLLEPPATSQLQPVFQAEADTAVLDATAAHRYTKSSCKVGSQVSAMGLRPLTGLELAQLPFPDLLVKPKQLAGPSSPPTTSSRDPSSQNRRLKAAADAEKVRHPAEPRLVCHGQHTKCS